MRRITIPLLFIASTVSAHSNHEEHSATIDTRWASEPFALIMLVLSALIYARGVRRIWSHSGTAHGIRWRDVAAFAGGWFWLFIALVSPLHPWGEQLFAWHMTQHEILMLAAAPLLVLGRPIPVMLATLTENSARILVSVFSRPVLSRVWNVMSRPFSAWLIHGVVLWLWHIPVLFQAALDSEWVHTLQHASFLLTAILFWWTVLERPRHVFGYGMAVLYVFTTALHSGLLGAFLTFAKAVWYPGYQQSSGAWGLTPLEDQQLGGLIMWIPAGIVYIIAGLALFAAWLRESERRMLRDAPWLFSNGGKA